MSDIVKAAYKSMEMARIGEKLLAARSPKTRSKHAKALIDFANLNRGSLADLYETDAPLAIASTCLSDITTDIRKLYGDEVNPEDRYSQYLSSMQAKLPDALAIVRELS